MDGKYQDDVFFCPVRVDYNGVKYIPYYELCEFINKNKEQHAYYEDYSQEKPYRFFMDIDTDADEFDVNKAIEPFTRYFNRQFMMRHFGVELTLHIVQSTSTSDKVCNKFRVYTNIVMTVPMMKLVVDIIYGNDCKELDRAVYAAGRCLRLPNSYKNDMKSKKTVLV